MAKKKNTATLRLRVWIEQEKETYIGIGSTLLLQHIEELGSLRKAAEALGMSYRRAWGKLKNAEARIGLPLVEKIKGQGQRFQPHSSRQRNHGKISPFLSRRRSICHPKSF